MFPHNLSPLLSSKTKRVRVSPAPDKTPPKLHDLRRFEGGTLFRGSNRRFLAWVEILSSGTFCANAQYLGAPKNVPITVTNFGSEGRSDLFLGSK